MSIFIRLLLIVICFLFLSVITVSPVRAHLMQAQHGTLNVVHSGAFVVLALPISTFKELDENTDGSVSLSEFNTRRSEIVSKIKAQVQLHDAHGLCELQGIMLNPVVAHDSPEHAIDQITVMGRFALQAAAGPLRLTVNIFDDPEPGQQLQIKAHREFDNQTARHLLTPQQTSHTFFQEGL